MKNKDFFLIILIIIPIESSDKCIFNDNDKAFRDNNFWMITNFNSLESLYFNCSKPVNMSRWGFKPNIPLILDNSLNIKILKIQSENEAFAFILENFKGFDIKSNPFKNVAFSRNIYKIWSISFSNVDFYNKNLLVSKTCDEHLLKNFPNENQFNGFMLSFDHSNKYSLNTCPIIFSNINLILCIQKI